MSLLKRSRQYRLLALEDALANYNRLRAKSGTEIIPEAALFENGGSDRTATTNQELLREAMLNTETLPDGTARRRHCEAKNALIAWCALHCESVLASDYRTRSHEQTQQAIVDTVLPSVMEVFDTIRKRVEEFLSQPGKHQAPRRSIRAFLVTVARNKLNDEFREYYKDRVEISAEEAERLEREGQYVIHSTPRGTTEERCYLLRFVQAVWQNAEDEEFLNPEVLAKLIADDIAVHSAVYEALPHIIKAANLTGPQYEFLIRVIQNREAAQDVLREWKAAGKKVPSNQTRYKEAILKKLRTVIVKDREFRSLFGDRR